jgi:hypothetical protein
LKSHPNLQHKTPIRGSGGLMKAIRHQLAGGQLAGIRFFGQPESNSEIGAFLPNSSAW